MGPSCRAGVGRTSLTCGRASTSAPASTCKCWSAWPGTCSGHQTHCRGATHDAKAIATSGLLKEIDPSSCIADKGDIGTGVHTPYKKAPNSELTEAQKQANKSLNEIRYVVE